MSKINKITAFTLAETLITLIIIGVLAALTIPNLITSYKEKQTIVKLKKVYSVLTNAYSLSTQHNGTPDTWPEFIDNSSEDIRAEIFFNKLKPYLSIAKECGLNTSEKVSCWGSDRYFKMLDGTPTLDAIHNGSIKAFILSDGTRLYLSVHKQYTGCINNEGYYPCVTVAVRTDNAPDLVYGKNLFRFNLYNSKVIPDGIPVYFEYPGMDTCSKQGYPCTAWAIYKENLDYMRCNDLDWSNKDKCD